MLLVMKPLQYQNIAMIAVFALFAVSIFGLAHTATSMDMSGIPHMPGCPFMGEDVLCTMTIMEHIQQWHILFAITPTKALALLFPMFLFIFVVSILAAKLRGIDTAHHQFFKKFFQAFNVSRFFNALQEAFSQGILHSKIYESATL